MEYMKNERFCELFASGRTAFEGVALNGLVMPMHTYLHLTNCKLTDCVITPGQLLQLEHCRMEGGSIASMTRLGLDYTSIVGVDMMGIKVTRLVANYAAITNCRLNGARILHARTIGTTLHSMVSRMSYIPPDSTLFISAFLGEHVSTIEEVLFTSTVRGGDVMGLCWKNFLKNCHAFTPEVTAWARETIKKREELASHVEEQ